MISSEFFLFLTIAFVSFGIHGTLIVSFVRRFDALVVGVYRSLSLVITMAPLLFFASVEEILAVREHLPLILLSSAIGALSFTLSLTGSRYLPVGIATSLRQAIIVPVAIVLGLLFLGEHLTFFQTLLLFGIGSCAVALTLLRSDHSHLDATMLWRGVFLSLLAGVGSAFAWYFFSIIAREMHPLVAAYFSEVAVGLFTLLYLVLLRVSGTHKANIRLPLKDARNIALVALLTIAATGSYAIAINYGPYPLASGIMMGSILVSTLMGWLVFGEHLKKSQIALIFAAVFCMFLIRIVS